MSRRTKAVFELEALEQRLLLSADPSGISAAGAQSDDPLPTSPSEEQELSDCPVQDSDLGLGYDPAAHLDDMFGQDDSEEGNESSGQPDDGASDTPGSATDDETEGHSEVIGCGSSDGVVDGGGQGTIEVEETILARGANQVDWDTLAEQLTMTLVSANGPPQGAGAFHLTPEVSIGSADRPWVLEAGQVLTGNGRVAGGLVNHGVLSPGNSPGMITIETDFTLGPDGTILIEIGGIAGAGVNPNGHDKINVTGDISLDGTIQVSLFNGFVPAAGQSFEILTWTGNLEGEVANWLGTTNIPGNPNLAFVPVLDEGAKTLTLQVVSTNTIVPAAEMALQDGLDRLQQLGTALSGIGELAESIPFLGGTLGSWVDIGHSINDAIRGQLMSLLAALPNQSEVTAEIESWDGTTVGGFEITVLGVLGHYGPTEFWWEISLEITQLHLNEALSDVAGAVFGALFSPQPEVDIRGTLALDFGFGYDGSDFFLVIEDLTARATVDAMHSGGLALDFPDAPGGLLNFDVTDWSVDLEVFASATPDPSILGMLDRIGMTTLGQLLGIGGSINPADAFNLDEGGSVDASFTLDGGSDFLGAITYTGTHTVRVQTDELLDGTDPDLTVEIVGEAEVLGQILAGTFRLKKTATETVVELENGTMELSAGPVSILGLSDGTGEFLLIGGDLAGTASWTIAAGPALPNIDISGTTMNLRFNTSPGEVATIDGETVNLPGGDYFRVAGNAVISLGVPEVSLTADFVFEPRDADMNTANGYEHVAVGLANLNFEFDDGLVTLMEVTDGSGAFLFTEDGMVGWATAVVNVLVPGFDLTGTFSLAVNDTDSAFGPLALDVNGTTVNIPMLPAGPYLRVAGEDAELELFGLEFSGDFVIEEKTTMGGTDVLTVGFTDVTLPLGTLTNDLVDIHITEGALIVTDEGAAGTGTATVTLDVPGVDVSGTFTLRVNTFDTAVDETVDVLGMPVTIDVPVGPYIQVNGDNVSLTVLGVTMTGDFSFEQRESLGGTQLVTVMATDVNFDIGTDILTLTNGQGLFLMTDSGIAGEASIDVGVSAFGESFSETFDWSFNNTNAPIDEQVDWEGDLKDIDLPGGPFNKFSTDGPVGFSVDVAGQTQAMSAALVLEVVDDDNGDGTPDPGDGDLLPDYVKVGVSELSTTLGGAGVNLDVSGGTGAFLLRDGSAAGRVLVDNAALRVGGSSHSFLTLTATGLRVEFNNAAQDVGPITVSVSDNPADDVTLNFVGPRFHEYLAVAGTAELELDLIANPALSEPRLSGSFLFELSGSGSSQVLTVAAQDVELDLNIGGAPVLSFADGEGAFVIQSDGIAGVAALDFDSGLIGLMGTISLELNTTNAAVNTTVTNPDNSTTVINLTDPMSLVVCVDNGHIAVGSLSFPFSFTVEVDTATGDVLFATKTGDPLLSIDGTTGDISIEPLSGIDLSNGFEQIGPIEFVQMLRTLANWLEIFGDSPIFDVEIPFTEGYTLGEALDWAQVFIDHVFSQMVTVELQSAQDLEQKLTNEGPLNLNGVTFDLLVGELEFSGITLAGVATSLDDGGDPTSIVAILNDAFQGFMVDGVDLGDLVEARVNRVDPARAKLAIALKAEEIAKGTILRLNNPGATFSSALGFPVNDGDPEAPDMTAVETERYSVEEFVVELGQLLTGLPGNYDPNAKQYTFPVNIGWDQDPSDPDIDPLTVSLPFGFDEDLGPFAGLNLEGELELTINAELNFTIGFDLNAAEVPRVISTTFIPAPSNGKLSANANFEVLLNENPDGLTPNWIPLTLTQVATNDNTNLDMLAADFNQLFMTAMWQGTPLNQLLYAQKAGSGIAISVLNEDANGNGVLDGGEDKNGDGNLDNQLGLINLLAIRSTVNDPFATELGFGVESYEEGGQGYFRTVSKSRVKGLFIEGAGFSGSIGVTTMQDITGSLELGFLSIDLGTPGNTVGTINPYAGGTFDLGTAADSPITLSLGLMDEESGSSRFYLSELMNGLEEANLGSFIHGPSLTGSFYAGLTNISAGIGPVNLPTGAEISLWIPDVTELDYNADPYVQGANDEGIFITYPDLGSFENFSNLSFTSIINTLNLLTDSLSQLSAFSFLDQKLPLIDVSVNDLVDYAVKFAELIEGLGQNNSGSIQDMIADLEDEIEALFGIDPEDEDIFSITLDDSDGNDLSLAAPITTSEGGDGTGTATYNPLGDNNGLIIKSTSTDNSFNGVTIRFRGDSQIAGNQAMAEWDADAKLLTIRINGGVTTANAVITAVNGLAGTPWNASLVSSDNPAGGNTGTGTYSLSALKFSLNYTTGYADSLPFQLDLNQLVSQLAGQNSAAAGFLDAVTTFIQASGSGVLTVSASADLSLDFGLDLTNPGKVRPFFYDSTGVELLAKVLGTDIEFEATIGAIAGVKISEGTVTLDADGNPDTDAGDGDRGASFRLGLKDNNGDGRHYFDENLLDFDNIELSLQGGVSAVLPIFLVVGDSETPLGSDADGNGDGYPDNYLVVDIPDLVRIFTDTQATANVAELRVPGTNNDLRFTRTTSGNENYVLKLQQNGGVGTGAVASFSNNTLTIQINSGSTTALAVQSEVQSLGNFTVTLLTPDNDAEGNTGMGTMTVSKLGLITPDIASLFEDLDMCDLINQNAGLLLDGLDALLGSIQDGLEAVAFNVDLPLIGDGFAGAADFIGGFRNGLLNDLRTEIREAGSVTAAIENAIKKVFWNILGAPGLNILVDPETGEALDPGAGYQQLDVTLDCDEGLMVNLRLASEIALIDTSGNPIKFDLGVPGFGLQVDGNVLLAAGFDLKLGFGFNKEDGFYFDSSAPAQDPELRIYLEATIPGLSASGTLLFLQLDVSDDPDDPSHFTGEFVVDLMDPNNDGKLTFAELTSSGTQFGDIIDAKLQAVADINLDLAASFGGSASFPRVVAEFHLDWMFDLEDGAQTPQIAFTNIGLDLGTFISDFLGPVLEEIRKVTEPFQPIIDVVTARIPVLSDLAGETITLLDLAELFGLLEPSTIDFIESVLEVVTLINNLEGIGEGSIIIPMGAFSLGQDEAGNRNKIQTLQNVAAYTAGELENAIMNSTGPGNTTTYQMQTAGFMGDATSIDNFSLPWLDNPSELFNIFIGEPVSLVEWRMPTFKFEFVYTQKIPIYPPLYAQFGGKIGAIIDIGFGYDTFGLQQLLSSEDKNPLVLLDGFYVIDYDVNGNERPELTLYGELFAGASIDLLIVEAGVRGGVFVEVNFDLNDVEEDGRVRPSEIYSLAMIDPRCIFNINGEIGLFLEAFLIIDLFFFSIDKTWRFAEITLLEFEITCPEPILATQSSGTLTLNIGSRAGNREEIDTTDGSETFIVKHLDGDGSNETVEVQWGGYKQTYSGVDKIVVEDAGAGNDLLDFRGVLSTVEVLSAGGGNDTIYLGDGANSFAHGGANDDTILASSADTATGVILYGDDGNDILTAGTQAITIYGGSGNDTITGSPMDDFLYGDDGMGGADGADTILGMAGNDEIFGGNGNDILEGGTGNDLIMGQGGADKLYGRQHDDILHGGDGDDEVHGGSGNDLLVGGLGDDFMNGYAGIDVLIGDEYGSVEIGGTTVDKSNITALLPTIATQGVSVLGIQGDGDDDPANDGDDLLVGGGNIDVLFGGEGDDFLYGGNLFNNGQTDVIEEDHNDFFDGGPGDDTIFGDDALGRTGDRNTGIAIKSSIFFDSNENGRRDNNETGFGGVKVELYIVGGIFVTETMTESDGAFEFVGLDPASYYLVFSTTLSGLSFTVQYAPEVMGGAGASLPDDDANDSDADATGETDPFLVDFNETESAVSAGFIGPAKVSVSDVSVMEGNSGQTELVFTVNLSHLQGAVVEIDYATNDTILAGPMAATAANGDFEAVSGTLVFNPGETTKIVTVLVNGDSTYEEHQQFVLELTRAQRMEDTPVNLEVPSQILGTIINDDAIPTISVSDYVPPSTLLPDGSRMYLVGEGEDASFTISLSNPSQHAISVLWRSDAAYLSNGWPAPEAATPNGLGVSLPDFELLTDMMITFQPGEVRKVVHVPVYDETEMGLDPLDEPDEHFYVDIYNPVNAQLGDSRGVGVIADDDGPVSVSISLAGMPTVFTTSVMEDSTQSVFVALEIRLSEASGQLVKVTYATAPGTAVEAVWQEALMAGTDYPDYVSLPEDTDPPELVFEPGETVKTVMVEVLPDNLVEGTETFFVNIISADKADIARHTPNESNHVVIDIENDDFVPGVETGPWSIRFSDVMYMVEEPDSGFVDAQITLERNPGSSNSVIVFYTLDGTATAGMDYDEVFRELVVFGQGQATATVNIRVYADDVAEGNETVKLYLRAPTGQPATGVPNEAELVIKDGDVPTLVVVPPPIFGTGLTEGSSGGTTPYDFLVVPVNEDGVGIMAEYDIHFDYEFVSLTARNGQDFIGINGSGTILANTPWATVTFDLEEDLVAELTETLALRVVAADGADLDPKTSSGVATIFDDDKATINGTVFYDRNGNGFKDANENGIKDVSVTLTYLDGGTEQSVTVMTNASGIYTADVFLGQVSINVDGSTVKSPYQGLLALLLGSGEYENTTNNENQSVDFDGVVGISPFNPVGYQNSFSFATPTGSDDVGRGGTDDTIFGGPGNDTIDAGAGDDHVVGGHWMTATDGNLPVNTGNYDAVLNVTIDPGNPDNGDPTSPPLHNVYDQGPIFSVDLSALGTFGSISGQIWFDSDNDGRQDGGEPLINMANFGVEVIVNLYDGESNWVNSLVTTDGTYAFEMLLKEDGTESLYVIQWELPSGFQFAVESPGGTAATINNDAFPAGRSQKIELSLSDGMHPSGPNVSNIDAGMRPANLMPAAGSANFEFSDPSYSVNENVENGILTVTIVRSDSSTTRAVLVRSRSGTAVENVNFEPVSILLNFEVGEVFKTVEIEINDVDAITDACATLHFYLELRDPTGRPLDEATVYIFGDGAGTITDDDLIYGGDDWDLILGDSGSIPANAVIAVPASLSTITFSGGPGKDTIYGGNGPDWIQGQLGDDWIAGNAGRDEIFGDLGDDIIVLERADDIFVGERVNGGHGFDTIISERDIALTQLISTGLNTADLWHRDSAGDAVALFKLTNVEMAQLFGGFQSNVFDIQGWRGSAFIVGRSGNDTLLVENDINMILKDASLLEGVLFQQVHGFFKHASVSLPNGSTYSLGSIENVTLTGGPSANVLDASLFSRTATLIGLGGNDTLVGGSGDDFFVFDADDTLGTDVVAGNAGLDTLYFGLWEVGTTMYETLAGIMVDLAILGPTSQTVVAGNLDLILIDKLEKVVGGNGDDIILGNDLNNILQGGPGNDALTGRAGNETYIFDTDTPWGTETITENLADAGFDTLDFSGTTTRTINLNMSILGSPQVINDNLTLVLNGEGIEQVIGGSLNDTLRGNSNNNVLRGGPGQDLLDGKSGDDILDGGSGNDDINGGPGTDTINETANTNFILSNASLIYGTGEVDLLDNVEVANLQGGASANTFTLTGWTGSGLIRGLGGFDTIVLAADADITLSDTMLTASTGLSMNLLSVENAILNGGSSNNVIDVSGFGGNSVLRGGEGDDEFRGGPGSSLVQGGLGTDTLIADLSGLPSEAEVRLQDGGLLVIWETMVMGSVVVFADLDLLSSVESVELTGTPNNDTFDVAGWTSGNIEVDGGAGLDLLTATVSGDAVLTDSGITFTGGAGSIGLSMIEGAILTGTDGNNILDARDFSGPVFLQGMGGDDILVASLGQLVPGSSSILDGGDGDDLFLMIEDGALNRVIVIGGEGADTLSFGGDVGLGLPAFAAGVTVNLSVTGVDQPAVAGDLTLRLLDEDVENLIGGDGIDTLTGNSLDNLLTGGAEMDAIDGLGGRNTIVETTDGAMTILTDGMLSIDGVADALANIHEARLTGGDGNNTIDATGFTGDTILSGEGGNDVLFGGTGRNRFIGGAGDDTMRGNLDEDTYVFDADEALGSDLIEDPGDNDLLDFSSTENVGLVVDLNMTGAAQAVHPTNLTLTIAAGTVLEFIIGGAQDDVFLGNTANNGFWGMAGNDFFDGMSGVNFVFEMRDADMVLTDSALVLSGVDEMGNAYTETDLLANIQQALLTGGESNNILDASAFTLGSVIADGGAGDDILIGSRSDDALEGGEGNDLLLGGAGNDNLSGGLGDDILNGGSEDLDAPMGDDDFLAGGLGNDRYVFELSLVTLFDSNGDPIPTLILGSDTIFETAAGGYADEIVGVGLAGVAIDLFDPAPQMFVHEDGTLVLTLTLSPGTVEDAY